LAPTVLGDLIKSRINVASYKRTSVVTRQQTQITIVCTFDLDLQLTINTKRVYMCAHVHIYACTNRWNEMFSGLKGLPAGALSLNTTSENDERLFKRLETNLVYYQANYLLIAVLLLLGKIDVDTDHDMSAAAELPSSPLLGMYIVSLNHYS
jgi:hypothetical protein